MVNGGYINEEEEDRRMLGAENTRAKLAHGHVVQGTSASLSLNSKRGTRSLRVL